MAFKMMGSEFYGKGNQSPVQKSAVKKAASALKHAMNFGKYHTDFKYEYSFPADGSKKRSKSSHKHKSAHDGAIIGTQRTVQSIEDEKKLDAEREANAKVENKSGTTTTDSGVKKKGSALKSHVAQKHAHGDTIYDENGVKQITGEDGVTRTPRQDAAKTGGYGS